VGTTDVTVTWFTTTPANYISGTGQIRVRQYVTRPSTTYSSSTDMVKYTVEF
jgi:hypothetical protein